MTKTPHEFLRGAWRTGALVAVIVYSAAELVCVRRHRADLGARARWLQAVSRRALRVLAVSVARDGQAPRGAVLAANHVGYLDILALAAESPTVFVSKKEVAGWPVFGWFARHAGTRFVDRTRRGDVMRMGEELRPVIEAGVNVAIFLEGTTTDGRDVLPFKPSLLQPAIENRWDVLPVAVGYRVPPGKSVAEDVSWWGDMKLIPHLANMTTMPWIDATLRFGTPQAGMGDRKSMARVLRSQVVDFLRT